MSGFPKIKGVRWITTDFPDLVALEVTLVNRKMQELGIEGLKLPETKSEMVVDLSKLAGIHPWYPEGSDDPSEVESSVDVEGIDNFIADVSNKDIIEAWIFYKRFKYSHDTRNI